ncbi:hypothetical protein BN1723_002815 [Verticillium longisporum]|uniref:Alcohol dehydrogenase-like C-terminal domain-containing protein n=1 Tax=Verticillium longisporum TaxID=100787 RepID=A0A0G4LJ28_VERLO|nr:hypothetical protein BN1723_002815 [Verticillium longisporum]
MSTDYKFEGWLGLSPESAEGKMEWGSFEPKKWTEDDVDIQITHCGVCGSDIHTLRSGWGAATYLHTLTSATCCVGHEIVGKAVKNDKREDVLKLGADQYIATGEDEGWEKKNARSLDLIICTVSSSNMPYTGYLGLLKPGGKLVQVGAPDGGNLPPVNAFSLILNGINLGGSLIGTPNDIREMLELAVEKKVKPWVETRPMKDANKAIVDFEAGKPRYRYVLVNEKHL